MCQKWPKMAPNWSSRKIRAKTPVIIRKEVPFYPQKWRFWDPVITGGFSRNSRNKTSILPPQNPPFWTRKPGPDRPGPPDGDLPKTGAFFEVIIRFRRVFWAKTRDPVRPHKHPNFPTCFRNKTSILPPQKPPRSDQLSSMMSDVVKKGKLLAYLFLQNHTYMKVYDENMSKFKLFLWCETGRNQCFYMCILRDPYFGRVTFGHILSNFPCIKC
jgi:hypothetical protein